MGEVDLNAQWDVKLCTKLSMYSSQFICLLISMKVKEGPWNKSQTPDWAKAPLFLFHHQLRVHFVFCYSYCGSIAVQYASTLGFNKSLRSVFVEWLFDDCINWLRNSVLPLLCFHFIVIQLLFHFISLYFISNIGGVLQFHMRNWLSSVSYKKQWVFHLYQQGLNRY